MSKTNLHFKNLFDIESLKKEIKGKEYIVELNSLFLLKNEKEIEIKFLKILNTYPLLRKELLDFILYKNKTILINDIEFTIKEHMHLKKLTKKDKLFWISFLHDSGFIYFFKNELTEIEKILFFISRGGSKIDDSISKMIATSTKETAHFIYVSGGAYWENKELKINELKSKMNFLLLNEFESWIKEKNLK